MFFAQEGKRCLTTSYTPLASVSQVYKRDGTASSTTIGRYQIATVGPTHEGQGGLEIWDCARHFEHLQILHANSRRLIATVATKHNAHLVSATLTHPHPNELEAWWQQLADVTCKIPPHLLRDAIVFRDANAQIDESLGKIGKASQHLTVYMAQPTFKSVRHAGAPHQGLGHTWTRPCDSHRAIDHILLPFHHCGCITKTRTRAMT